jgi:hypothetical protein
MPRTGRCSESLATVKAHVQGGQPSLRELRERAARSLLR